MPKYHRDGRSPIPEKESTSKTMSSIRYKNTKPELLLRKELRETGILGYRIHWKNAPGNPDIAFPGRKIAIFVHGCFWHRCPHCGVRTPKSHTEYWDEKFAKTIARDKKNIQLLKEQGWKTIIFWECQLYEDLANPAKKIKALLIETDEMK